jgi:hypothetical protein
VSCQTANSCAHFARAGELFLVANEFTGTLTDELHGLESIQRLALTQNEFHGDINDVVDGLTTLRKSRLFLNSVRIAHL